MNSSNFFGSFAVKELDAAREFYATVLDLQLTATEDYMELQGKGGQKVLVYAKPDHQPAGFTVLNIAVPDIRAAVTECRSRGVRFEQYGEGPLKTDADGVHSDECATIAWFRDPSGNYVALIEER